MIAFKSWLVTTLSADATLQGYLKDSNGNMNIFPLDVDIQPEQFPCITYGDIALTTLTIPQGKKVGILQLDIWSTNNALEVENIYEQVMKLIQFQTSISPSYIGNLWWVRENGARDAHTPSRRIWHKTVDLKYWTNNSTNT